MSYPAVSNKQIQSLKTFDQDNHTVGKFNEKSCGGTFNLLEKDYNTTSISTLQVGVPLMIDRNKYFEEVPF